MLPINSPHMQFSRLCLHVRSWRRKRKSWFTQAASFCDVNILLMVNFQQLWGAAQNFAKHTSAHTRIPQYRWPGNNQNSSLLFPGLPDTCPWRVLLSSCTAVSAAQVTWQMILASLSDLQHLFLETCRLHDAPSSCHIWANGLCTLDLS